MKIRYYVCAIALFNVMQEMGLANFDREQGVLLSPKIPEDHMPLAIEAAEAYCKVTRWLGYAAEAARLVCCGLAVHLITQLF
ncbi:hypothetical protein F3I62_19025 [Pseudomonas sp. R-28-1W-6]|uniref:hypothetical protein n=1 Tax=Pseudomonas sp. R-28-1W-6 TaxID=2650101 RepID=UPI0013663CA5|nr:hypothetical protein [Pseudomonas sp. R-28-1W-6]MWV14199.1 hypothetical protein [Pseudomonas sp. R-28-1W-6]